MMKILFGYKTAHTQYVVSFSYPQFPKILRTVRIIGTRHTIINQMNLLGSTIFPSDQIADHLTDDYYLIRKQASHPLSPFQNHFGHNPPFVTIIVRPMVGKHHFQSQHFSIRYKQCRSDGMDMQYIRPQLFCLIHRLERMNNRFKRFLFRRFYIYQFHTVPFRQPVMHIILPADNRHILPPPCDTRKKLLTMRFHTTHHIGNATGTGHNNLHKE